MWLSEQGHREGLQCGKAEQVAAPHERLRQREPAAHRDAKSSNRRRPESGQTWAGGRDSPRYAGRVQLADRGFAEGTLWAQEHQRQRLA
jgi:hypothetical protein